jgi:hypothetical protein
VPVIGRTKRPRHLALPPRRDVVITSVKAVNEPLVSIPTVIDYEHGDV